MQATEFVLGPSLDNVYERGPLRVSVVQLAGRRNVSFQGPPTSPGGFVHVFINPPLNPGDDPPINIYAFFVQPVESVPDADSRTPEWFFKGKFPKGFAPGVNLDDDGLLTIKADGVTPSLNPYFVQVIMEYKAKS